MQFTIECFAQKPIVSKGSINYLKFTSSKYISPREIVIWLPENYDASNKYKVIYMHDAQALFDTAVSWNHQTWDIDETMQQLINQNKIKQCIVVGIYHADRKRRSEYFPQKVFNALPQLIQDSLRNLKDQKQQLIFNGDLNADSYLKFIVNELKPFVDSTYSTASGLNNTFIAGSSMGALISLYALCEYPSIFGGAACLSTHWTGTANYIIDEIPEAIISYFEKNIPSGTSHKIYFDYGSIGLDSLYEPYQIKIDAIMKSKNYNNKHWITKAFIGEGHNEQAWRKRINIPFKFLMNP